MKRLSASARDSGGGGHRRPRSAQDSVAQFYKGRQITVVVGSSPGGGYDIYARLMARHMGKYIPGNPTMVVTNMPGAGSNAMVAHLYNVAPKDGTFIGAPQNNAIMDALFDAVLGNARRLRHDATKLIQIGSATTDHYVCIGRVGRPDQNLQAGAHEGMADRREPARHLDARLSGDAQQHHGRQDQAGQRLSRHARDHARDREERGARPVRLFLVEPECAEAGLGQIRLHPRDRAGARQGQSGDQQDGRAAGRRLRHLAGKPQDHGADLFVGDVRPAVLAWRPTCRPTGSRRCARPSWTR